MACFGSKCVGVCRNLMSPTFLGVFLDVESDKKNRFKFRPLFHPPGPKHPFCFFCSYLLNERSDENRPFFCLFSRTILFYFWCWFFCNQKTRWSHSSFSRKSHFFVTNFLSPIFCHQIFLSPIFLDVFFDVESDKKNRLVPQLVFEKIALFCHQFFVTKKFLQKSMELGLFCAEKNNK